MKQETVNSIPPWFVNATLFDYIKVVGKVYSIGTNAFSQLDQVTNITLNEAMKTIKDFAFESMKKISTIQLTKNVETLGVGLFKNCEGLSSFTVIAENPYYQSINGVLYTKPVSVIEKAITLIAYPMNTGYRTNKITEITAYAFL